MTHTDLVLEALHRGRVEFIVVGGVAAAAHGSARVTYDVDILYSRSEGNIARLVKALQPLTPYPRGAPPGLPFEWNAATVTHGFHFTLATSLGGLDLLGEVAGLGRHADAVAHATPMRLTARHDTLVIDLDWLIHSKRAAGRPKDLEVIAELEILRELGETASRSAGSARSA